jgi:hypothetical protein
VERWKSRYEEHVVKLVACLKWACTEPERSGSVSEFWFGFGLGIQSSASGSVIFSYFVKRNYFEVDYERPTYNAKNDPRTDGPETSQ